MHRIMIVINGGSVTNVLTDGVELTVSILDHDNVREGMLPEELRAEYGNDPDFVLTETGNGYPAVEVNLQRFPYTAY